LLAHFKKRILLDALSRELPNDEDLVESTRPARALFAEIAEADYIKPIQAASLKKQTKR
jgi:hypothetical protein